MRGPAPHRFIILIAGIATLFAANACEKSTLRASRDEFRRLVETRQPADQLAISLERFIERYPDRKTNPHLIDALRLLGQHHERAGRSGPAADWYERAVALAPEDPDLLNLLGYHYARHGVSLDRAVDILETAVRIADENDLPARKRGFFHDSLGWALHRRGEFEAAVVHLEMALQLAGDVAVIQEHLEEARRALGGIDDGVHVPGEPPEDRPRPGDPDGGKNNY